MAIVLTYVSLLLAVVGVALLVVPPIVDQTNRFVTHVPNYIENLRDNKTIQRYDDKYDITPKLKDQAAKLPSHFGDAATALQNIAVGLFAAIITVVTVLVMTFFLLLDGRRAFEWFLDELGPERGERVRAIADDVYRSVGGYVVGNLTISLIAGVTTYVVLTILGVPFSVPLAVLMAFLDLIPLIGATIAGIAIAIVTAVGADFPRDVIIWAVFFILYQQAENNLLQPLIYRRTVALHPLLVIVAILIGAALLGIVGALLAIPIAGAIQIVVKDSWAVRKSARRTILPRDDEPVLGAP
jgi:predicted PurR-regulated permease PerM